MVNEKAKSNNFMNSIESAFVETENHLKSSQRMQSKVSMLQVEPETSSESVALRKVVAE